LVVLRVVDQLKGAIERDKLSRLVSRSEVGDIHAQRQRVVGPHAGRRRWVVRTAAVIALTTTAIAATTLLSPGSPDGPNVAVAAVLRHLAQVAANQSPTVQLGAAEYLYVDSEDDYVTAVQGPDGYRYLQPEERDVWIGADGSGRLITTAGQPVFLTPADQAAWIAAGSPTISTAPSDTAFGACGLSDGPTDLSTLPTDPTTLGQLIAERKIEGGPPGPAEDFIEVGDLLRETNASPVLRTALFQVAENLSGIELLGSVSDHAGRSGIGLAIVQDGVRDELIFDSQTSALLGEEETIIGPDSDWDAPIGTVLGWSVYLSSSIVDKLPPVSSQTEQGPVSQCGGTGSPGSVPVPLAVNPDP
jgi:hypothetical protein